MLDVLLVAVLVAWMKMGDLVEFTVGSRPLGLRRRWSRLSLTASAQYDPHALWDDRRFRMNQP